MKHTNSQRARGDRAPGAARGVRWYKRISVKLAIVLGLAVLSVQFLSSALILESLRASQADVDPSDRAAAAPYTEYISTHLKRDAQGRWVPTAEARKVVESFLDQGETYVWLDVDDRVVVLGPRMSKYTHEGDLWWLCNSREYCPLSLGPDGERRAGSTWVRLAVAGQPIGTFVLIWFEDLTLQARQQRRLKLDLYSRLVAAALLATLTSLLLVSLVTRRLSRLSADASAPLADDVQNVDLPGPFSEEGDDEIARLAAALNTMRGRIQQLVARLEDRDRQRREWIAQVSHDLRTPLTALSACLDRAAAGMDASGDSPIEQSVREGLNVARQDCDRLQVLVEDLFELARLDAREQLVREPVPPGELVRQTVSMLEPLAAAEGVRISAIVSPSLPTIQADGRRLMRALENMVRNAAHYAAGRVMVSVERDGDGLRFMVADDGPGLPLVDGQVVLGQTDDRARRPDSAGLGLIVTRRVAQAHGGSLGGANRPEGGAMVWIRIPIVGPPPGDGSASENRSA